jgi:hypothetical protein
VQYCSSSEEGDNVEEYEESQKGLSHDFLFFKDKAVEIETSES